MLSPNNPITTVDIHEIKALGTHRNCWLLKGFNADKVVVKSDWATTAEVKSANVGIKAVVPGAKVRVLSPQELAAIEEYIRRFEEAERDYEALGMSLDAAEKEALEAFKWKRRIGGHDSCFHKMEAFNVMDLADAYQKRLDGDKSDLKMFRATLNAPGGLERLGKIVAVDLFIQNCDRIWPNETGAFGTVPLSNEIAVKTRCIRNLGNVFRFDSGNGNEVGALDFVYQLWDINKPLSECERSTGCKWGARHLSDRTKREGFAKDIAHDLEIVLHPKRSKFSLKSKLDSNAASRLSSGMVEGCRLIKAKLESKYNPNRWTPGAKERYLIMCQVR